MANYFLAGAVVVACIGAIWDIFTYRIPNVLTYTAMVAGLFSHLLFEGWRGGLVSLGGLAIGGGIFLVLYIGRTMGAGDVKLMAAVGAVAGISSVIEIALYSAIAGGILALMMALYKKRFRSTMVNTFDMLRFHFRKGAEMHPKLNLENPEALRFAYGVAIFAGTLFVFLVQV